MNAIHDFSAPPAAVAELFRRSRVRLQPITYREITLNDDEYVDITDIVAAEQTGALPQRGAR